MGITELLASKVFLPFPPLSDRLVVTNRTLDLLSKNYPISKDKSRYLAVSYLESFGEECFDVAEYCPTMDEAEGGLGR